MENASCSDPVLELIAQALGCRMSRQFAALAGKALCRIEPAAVIHSMLIQRPLTGLLQEFLREAAGAWNLIETLSARGMTVYLDQVQRASVTETQRRLLPRTTPDTMDKRDVADTACTHMPARSMATPFRIEHA